MDSSSQSEPRHGDGGPSARGITERIEERRADKDFQDRLRRAVERNQEALDLLAK